MLVTPDASSVGAGIGHGMGMSMSMRQDRMRRETDGRHDESGRHVLEVPRREHKLGGAHVRRPWERHHVHPHAQARAIHGDRAWAALAQVALGAADALVVAWPWYGDGDGMGMVVVVMMDCTVMACRGWWAR